MSSIVLAFGSIILLPSAVPSIDVSTPLEHHPNETMKSRHRPALLLRLLGTAQQTSSAGGNKTGLLTCGGVSGDGRSLTNMLMVTLLRLSALHFAHPHTSIIRTPP